MLFLARHREAREGRSGDGHRRRVTATPARPRAERGCGRRAARASSARTTAGDGQAASRCAMTVAPAALAHRRATGHRALRHRQSGDHREPARRQRVGARPSIDAFAEIARAADRLGYFHHGVEPRRDPARRLTPAADAATGILQSRSATRPPSPSASGSRRTSSVLGYHHPLEIVKRYGTLDVVSRGRLILGVGVGSLAEEFAMLGRDFAGRGPKAREAIPRDPRVVRKREPAFHGEFYDFADVTIDPVCVQADVPIWMGGRTRALAAPRDRASTATRGCRSRSSRKKSGRSSYARRTATRTRAGRVRSTSVCRPSRRSIRSASRSACTTRSPTMPPAARPC